MGSTPEEKPPPEPKSIAIIMVDGYYPGLQAFMDYVEDTDRHLNTITTVTVYESIEAWETRGKK